MKATIIHAQDAVFGVLPVPGSNALAVFSHRGGEWFGVGSVGTHDTSALIGSPRPAVRAALDLALAATHKPESER